MNTHQQPSSRDIAEAWYKALPEIVAPQAVGERRWTVRPEEVVALLTSHSQAIRERVEKKLEEFNGYYLYSKGDLAEAAQSGAEKMVDDILALLPTDKETPPTPPATPAV